MLTNEPRLWKPTIIVIRDANQRFLVDQQQQRWNNAASQTHVEHLALKFYNCNNLKKYNWFLF